MFELVDMQPQEAVIKVVGVGGCGGNAVDHMIEAGVQGVEFICANTDAQALKRNRASVQLQLGANVAGVVMVIASLHILRVNTTLLPPELRPALWRRVVLVAMALFYGFFVTLWLTS